MITRAIVDQVDYKLNKVKVNIPILDGIRNTENSTLYNSEYRWASMLYIPGMEVHYKAGDVVVVGFEDNDLGSPIILGFLKLAENNIDESRIYLNSVELAATNKFTAPESTVIGKTTYQELFDAVEGHKESSSTEESN